MGKSPRAAATRRKVLHEGGTPRRRGAAKPASVDATVVGRSAASSGGEGLTALSGSIPHGEFMHRRERVLKELGKGVGLVFAGTWDDHHGEVDPFFFYLTGISTEQGACVLLDPTHEDPSKRVVLFLRPVNPEADRWDGLREEIGAGLRAKHGFRTIMRTTHLPMMLTAAARRSKSLCCLHPFAVYPAAVSEDLATFRKVTERMPGVAIEDRTQVLASMRARKSRAEILAVQRAADITALGFAAAMRTLAPGVGEGAVQRAIEFAYGEAGAQGLAFGSIVGSGLNATVLHYRANNHDTKAGELVVVDSGAKFAGYCADVTRTLPVSGRFTREQRAVYEVVLMAQEAAIAACKPGAPMYKVDAAARAVLESAGLGDYFVHGIGHHLGIKVHDIDPKQPLEPGNIVTIEPGVYIPAKKLGIRIEDDVLITSRGREVMTRAIPKTVEDVERAMADRE